jgi:hypothetical protein
MCSEELTGRVCAIDFESVECSRRRSVASFARKESGMMRAEDRFDIWSLLNPSGTIVVSLRGMRHDRNTAISDMERERPFPVNGNHLPLTCPYRGELSSRHMPESGRKAPCGIASADHSHLTSPGIPAHIRRLFSGTFVFCSMRSESLPIHSTLLQRCFQKLE